MLRLTALGCGNLEVLGAFAVFLSSREAAEWESPAR
jgi:hypothetical protein